MAGWPHPSGTCQESTLFLRPLNILAEDCSLRNNSLGDLSPAVGQLSSVRLEQLLGASPGPCLDAVSFPNTVAALAWFVACRARGKPAAGEHGACKRGPTLLPTQQQSPRACSFRSLYGISDPGFQLLFFFKRSCSSTRAQSDTGAAGAPCPAPGQLLHPLTEAPCHCYCSCCHRCEFTAGLTGKVFSAVIYLFLFLFFFYSSLLISHI